MFLSFRRDLARSSREKKLRISNALFFIVQFCASYFQVLIRKSGGARASGKFIRFLAGPARTYLDSFAIFCFFSHSVCETPRIFISRM